MDHVSWILGEAVVASIAAVLSAVLILLLRPLLTGYALAIPDGRSSHRVLTPQWGDIAVIAATVIVALAAVWVFGRLDRPLLTICAATLLLALVGGIDDVYFMPILPRLLLQAQIGRVGTALHRRHGPDVGPFQIDLRAGP
jgi:UDP-N-acetylmuramyl pentapeptide phosphotransferase/UDP-N-acetylglucosamine-1-phosphate transferase